jgi:XTP/dITP diphosphohydrolase
VSSLLLATRSVGKLRELRPIFAARGLEVIDLDEAGIPEDPAEEELEAFESFEENALAKGRYFHRRAGLPTVADDSGIVVRALGGAPGVRSKRWSGRTDLHGQALDDANNALLLQRLAGVADRTACYVAVAVFVDGPLELVRRGEVSGRIVDGPARGTGGFGYDPFFVSDELGKSFGEASDAEKARISHRARAFALLIDALAAR